MSETAWADSADPPLRAAEPEAPACLCRAAGLGRQDEAAASLGLGVPCSVLIVRGCWGAVQIKPCGQLGGPPPWTCSTHRFAPLENPGRCSNLERQSPNRTLGGKDDQSKRQKGRQREQAIFRRRFQTTHEHAKGLNAADPQGNANANPNGIQLYTHQDGSSENGGKQRELRSRGAPTWSSLMRPG